MRLIDLVRERIAQRSKVWTTVTKGEIGGNGSGGNGGNGSGNDGYLFTPGPVPPAPGNPMQMKEPYDMFYRLPLISAYVPGWLRKGNFGTVERIPPNQPGQVGVLPGIRGTERLLPQSKPQHGVVPSVRQQAEYKEPYSFHQRAPPPVTAPLAWPRKETHDFSYKTPVSQKEPYDFSFRGQIGSPRRQYKMASSQRECYDFTY